jgi:hypothetical protein
MWIVQLVQPIYLKVFISLLTLFFLLIDINWYHLKPEFFYRNLSKH